MTGNINRRDLLRVTGGTAIGLTLQGSVFGARRDVEFSGTKSRLIELSGNENSYGPSPVAKNAIITASSNANRYTYAAQLKLVEKIARKEGVSAEHIVLGSGSSEVLLSAGLACCQNDKDTVSADLGYGMVPGYAGRVGGDIHWVPLDEEMRHDLDNMADHVNSKTGMVYICNPNNPTGTLVNGDRLRDFCTSMPKDVVIVVDEAYLEFTDNFDEQTMLDMVKLGHNVIVTRTFSKIHGLAGVRLGYAIARPDIAERISRVKMCKFQGPLAVSAANASLDDEGFRDYCRERTTEGRALVHQLCDDLGLEHTDAAGNFSFIDPKMSNDTFKKRMLSFGLEATRPFPPKPDWARVTIGTTEEMKVFTEALPRIVNA